MEQILALIFGRAGDAHAQAGVGGGVLFAEDDGGGDLAVAEPGELLHVIADAHIYDRHIPIVKELIQRETYPAPRVTLNPEVKNFYDFTVDDFTVENYQTGPQVKNIPIAI